MGLSGFFGGVPTWGFESCNATSPFLFPPLPKELVTNLEHEVMIKVETKREVISFQWVLHTCSHGTIRVPAEEEMRLKSRTAFSLSLNGSELIKQSHSGPSSSCRSKPTPL